MLRHEDNAVARLSGNNLQPLSGISVTVTDKATGLPASLYDDAAGTKPIPQPLTTDDNGYYGFYAPDGTYTLTFSGVRIATFTRQIVLDDPKDNPYASKAELAAGQGAAGIGYGAGTVADALTALARGSPRSQIIATRGRMPVNVEGAGATNYTRYETVFTVRTGPRPVNSVQLVFCNRYAIAGGEVFTSNNDYQIESAINYGGPTVPVTFHGMRSPTFSTGATLVISDKVGLSLPSNTTLQLRSAAIVAAGQKIPVGQPTSVQYNGYSSTATVSQIFTNASMTMPAGGATPALGFVPMAVIGVPDQRHVAVLLWGDSITYGQGDTTGEGTYGHVGWAERGLIGAAPGGFNIPFANVSRAGDNTATWTSAAFGYQGTRWSLLEYVTHAVFAMGINDPVAGRTLAQLQANVQIAWANAKRMGVKVYQTTLTPNTTSTDNWATLANQTIATNYNTAGVRGLFNAWLPSQVTAGLIDGIIDLNSSVCDPANPDKWAVNGTANYMTIDGLHPSIAGHAKMATVLNALAIGWTV